MFGFIWWILIGFLAGGIARFLVPGRQPLGCLTTTALGLVGSLVGGFISSLLFGYDPRGSAVHASGLLMSTLGAWIVLALVRRLARDRSDV